MIHQLVLYCQRELIYQIYPTYFLKMSQKESELAHEQRVERISATIALLQAQKSEIEASGVVAPPGCSVVRYQACMNQTSLLVLSTPSQSRHFSQNQ